MMIYKFGIGGSGIHSSNAMDAAAFLLSRSFTKHSY